MSASSPEMSIDRAIKNKVEGKIDALKKIGECRSHEACLPPSAVWVDELEHLGRCDEQYRHEDDDDESECDSVTALLDSLSR